MTFVQPLGDLAVGDSVPVSPAGGEYAGARLPIEVVDAEVVAQDAQGEPVLVRRRAGKGAIYLCTIPLEYFGAVRRNGLDDDGVSRLYRALAQEAGITAPVRVDRPRVLLDEMRHEDGTLYTWFISTEAESVSVGVSTGGSNGSGGLIDVITGETLGPVVDFTPYQVRVARHASQ